MEREKIARVALDGHVKADLDWKEAKEKARSFVEQGFRLFWELNLGLFSDLAMPLKNQAQYLSLGISLEHFRETIWKEFETHSIGVCYYRGSADFSEQIRWDAEQDELFRRWLKEVFPDDEGTFRKNPLWRSLYCRDVAADYLSLLSSQLSDHIPSYLLLDISKVESPLLQAQLVTQDRFDRFHLAIKGCRWPFHGMVWREDIIESPRFEQEAKIGICLPPFNLYNPLYYEGLESAMKSLLEKGTPFRVIPESMLVTEWDGLDEILYVPAGLTQQGKRQLQGFCAAGGAIVSLTF